MFNWITSVNHELVCNAIPNLKKSGVLNNICKFLELISHDIFPLYNIYFLFFLDTVNSLHSTDAIPPHVLMLSPCSTAAIPPQYWIASTVLTLSPHMYCSYPSAVLMLFLRSTDAIPPQYWCYPPQYWTASAVLMLPPQYWTASAVLNRRYTGWSIFQKIFSINCNM